MPGVSHVVTTPSITSSSPCCDDSQAVIFKDMDSLLKMSAPNPTGTLAFLLDEEALLVRVSGGWQYVSVSWARAS